MTNSVKNLFIFFKLPLIILIGIGVYSVLLYGFKMNLAATAIALGIIALGSFDTIKETVISLKNRQFALDYIAILAITVGLVSGQYLVAMVIVLMLSGGQTLEKYGTAKAKESLTALTERIPNEVVLWNQGKAGESLPIEKVKPGEEIMVRKGEVVPLDGILLSDDAVIDESSLTGEPFAVEKAKDSAVRSGTVNMGNIIVVKVTAADQDSTYRKIIELVRQAQIEKAPLIRLADRYSVWFTVITLILAAAGYALDHSLERVLAVLVVATPCPLILATPIALFGGMNSAAKHRILTKKISSLEILSRVSAIVFDKTGTLTAGRPIVSSVEVVNPEFDLPQVYSIAEAIERNSLHPLAKAIVASAKEAGAPRIVAEKINEKIGSGISAIISGAEYSLQKLKDVHHRNAVELLRNGSVVARFEFEDRLKDDSVESVGVLKKIGMALYVFTGDRQENADKIIGHLGEAGSGIVVCANCTPEDKKTRVEDLKRRGDVVAMIGDGINDAPALATADVGLVFSNEEHTAASEAADVVFLGGDLSAVPFIISIAKRTIRIALESIWVGIGLSIFLMFCALFGYVPPLLGAFFQELIDVLVIFNALRASRLSVLS